MFLPSFMIVRNSKDHQPRLWLHDPSVPPLASLRIELQDRGWIPSRFTCAIVGVASEDQHLVSHLSRGDSAHGQGHGGVWQWGQGEGVGVEHLNDITKYIARMNLATKYVDLEFDINQYVFIV